MLYYKIFIVWALTLNLFYFPELMLETFFFPISGSFVNQCHLEWKVTVSVHILWKMNRKKKYFVLNLFREKLTEMDSVGSGGVFFIECLYNKNSHC